MSLFGQMACCQLSPRPSVGVASRCSVQTFSSSPLLVSQNCFLSCFKSFCS